MDISLLNVRIQIEENQVAVDSLGNHTATWHPYYSCYATVSGEGGKEMTTAGMIVDDSTVDFSIRWCKKAAAIVPTSHRVVFGGVLYNIESVDHMGYKRKSIKLHCRKARR